MTRKVLIARNALSYGTGNGIVQEDDKVFPVSKCCGAKLQIGIRRVVECSRCEIESRFTAASWHQGVVLGDKSSSRLFASEEEFLRRIFANWMGIEYSEVQVELSE